MKRALTGKAKRSFVIFAAAVTTAVAGFSVGVVSAANTQSEKYAVPAGGTVYDNSYAKIEIGSEGKIYRSWNKDTIWSMIIRKNILSDARRLRMIRGQNP